MSLFGAIQMGGNTLRAMQIGLHVVGNNIANANTPGYVRQEAIFVPAPVQVHGNLILGTGVLVDSIVQKLDRFVQERLVGAHGDRANAEVQEEVYRDLESALNALSDGTDLSSSLTSFFNAIHEVMKDPGNIAMRNLAIGAGSALTENFGQMYRGVFAMQGELNERVSAISDEINGLAEEVRRLNLQISSIEGGDSSGSQAAGLRVQRQEAVNRLSELIGIRVDEQPSGGLSVAVGGEFLVFEGQRREVAVTATNENGAALGFIEFIDTHSPLDTTSGELQGLYTGRDEIVGGFLERLDELAGTLAFEFNKVYSQGQGLVGFKQLTSVETIDDASAALDEAGLEFTPVSGSFNVVVSSKTNPQLTHTHRLLVDLNGLDEDTTLTSLAAQLDAIADLSASISTSGALVLSSESSDVEFSFAGDTSGVLAALGINTFFTGSTAASLNVNAELKGIENASKFAASLGGIGNDAGNAERLAAFLDRPLESASNASLADLYNQILNEVAQGSSIAQSVAEGYRVFEGTLEGQQQAVSGVSVDEEAIKMITLQRIYQASARYIQTCSELLELLVQL
ncbi:MAG: flagellar hook-associated protein FlgK [Planctomycetes bacterium]|nr:flagellar hook-associated protein FlgK [Planctomycetota bacterium]